MLGYRRALLGTGVLGLLGAMLGSACSGPTWRFEPDAQAIALTKAPADRPKWTRRPAAGVDQQQRITAVGVGADPAEAQERALTRLAQSLSVRIEAAEVSGEAFTRRQGAERRQADAARSTQRAVVARLTRSRVDVALLGAQLDELWVDPATQRVYARVVAERALAVDGLAARARAQATASAEWRALAQLPGATRLDQLRRASRAKHAARAADEALQAARSVASGREDLQQEVERAQLAVQAQGVWPAAVVEALARNAKEQAQVFLRVDPFSPPGLETTLRGALSRLGLPVVARAPAAVEISLAHQAHALGSDADGQQRVGWRVSLEARDAASGASAGAIALEGVAAGPSHAEALATAAIAARRRMQEVVDAFLRETLLGEQSAP